MCPQCRSGSGGVPECVPNDGVHFFSAKSKLGHAFNVDSDLGGAPNVPPMMGSILICLGHIFRRFQKCDAECQLSGPVAFRECRSISSISCIRISHIRIADLTGKKGVSFHSGSILNFLRKKLSVLEDTQICFGSTI
jgi:hypothetical protein